MRAEELSLSELESHVAGLELDLGCSHQAYDRCGENLKRTRILVAFANTRSGLLDEIKRRLEELHDVWGLSLPSIADQASFESSPPWEQIRNLRQHLEQLNNGTRLAELCSPDTVLGKYLELELPNVNEMSWSSLYEGCNDAGKLQLLVGTMANELCGLSHEVARQLERVEGCTGLRFDTPPSFPGFSSTPIWHQIKELRAAKTYLEENDPWSPISKVPRHPRFRPPGRTHWAERKRDLGLALGGQSLGGRAVVKLLQEHFEPEVFCRIAEALLEYRIKEGLLWFAYKDVCDESIGRLTLYAVEGAEVFKNLAEARIFLNADGKLIRMATPS